MSAFAYLGDDLDATTVPASLQSLVDSLAEQVTTDRNEAVSLEDRATRR